MPEAADQPAAPKRVRSLTRFYVAICAAIVLGLLGGWFWQTWTTWWFDAGEARSRQAEAAAQLGVPVEKVVDLGDGIKLELVLVPGGRFLMGSPAEEKGRSEDEAQHWVRITKPFYIGKYEVTQEVWEKVTGTNPSAFKGAKNPVECVRWDDCQEFLKNLNALGKERGQFRLPTEAEWEWACRAGTRTRFCFGDDEGALGDYASYVGSLGPTHPPVGTKKPNAWGLYDFHGNVWEWCGDWHGEYSHGRMPKADPTGPATGAYHVLRGGSWEDSALRCRSSRRYVGSPGFRIFNFGFRVVLSSSRTP